MLRENFKEKKQKTLFVMSCPKLLFFPKMQFGHLGVNIINFIYFEAFGDFEL